MSCILFTFVANDKQSQLYKAGSLELAALLTRSISCSFNFYKSVREIRFCGISGQVYLEEIHTSSLTFEVKSWQKYIVQTNRQLN